MIREEHGKLGIPCSSRIINEMLPEINTVEMRDFFKPIIHSQAIQCSVYRTKFGN